eukprot:TRINITY_DN31151_c0_g1_i1.p2 TRINITY_DN31151_c0_g1~~TRINITY_DN31151_c0_g1_i1.p2  ORF type:complete len:119 (+),score=0.44 TRINITY_DN31151_c0_g1_i1:363-719(+)
MGGGQAVITHCSHNIRHHIKAAGRAVGFDHKAQRAAVAFRFRRQALIGGINICGGLKGSRVNAEHKSVAIGGQSRARGRAQGDGSGRDQCGQGLFHLYLQCLAHSHAPPGQLRGGWNR